MLEQFAHTLVEMIFGFGYMGVFVLMMIESSFIPFPSEIVLIPAGYLAYEGKMNVGLIFLFGTLGSMAGAYVNYFLAAKLGRAFLEKYGNYFFISHATLCKMDGFFAKHGAISTFSGRLIPGIRQLISIPAGLSKMDLKLFSFYTFLGAGIWNVILIALGYFIGDNQELIHHYLKEITLGVLVMLAVVFVWYYKRNKKEDVC